MHKVRHHQPDVASVLEGFALTSDEVGDELVKAGHQHVRQADANDDADLAVVERVLGVGQDKDDDRGQQLRDHEDEVMREKRVHLLVVVHEERPDNREDTSFRPGTAGQVSKVSQERECIKHPWSLFLHFTILSIFHLKKHTGYKSN